MDIKDSLGYAKTRLANFFLPTERNGYRARIFTGSFLPLFFIAMLVLKIGFMTFMAGFSGNPFYADVTKASLIELANSNRARYNLPPLAENQTLNAAARLKALDMEKNGYFNHVSPSGVNPWYWFDLAGYNYRYAGENLAIGFIESDEVQNAWEASPTHEANIVNAKYQEIGIAVYRANFNGNPATIVVQLFGARQGGAVAASPAAGTAAGTNEAEKLAARETAGAVLGVSTTNSTSSVAARAAKFFSNDYFSVVQWVIYGALALVVLLLLLNFALSADFGRAEILAKAFGFIALMAVFALLDRTLVIALIPHNLSIF